LLNVLIQEKEALGSFLLTRSGTAGSYRPKSWVVDVDSLLLSATVVALLPDPPDDVCDDRHVILLS
jgi:hypothetical protein